MATEADVRRMALALPEAVEAPHFELTSFRVAGKIFCTAGAQPGCIMLKLDPEDQRNLAQGRPDVITAVPGYWGQKGSTYLAIAQIDKAELEALLRLAWSGVAPKRLIRLDNS
jgi:hypothetical protein